MTAEDFVAWSEAHGDGKRYELLDGEIIAMASERVAHARVKGAIFQALRQSTKTGTLPREAFPDGMAVRIDDHTVFEPDALVRCGPLLPDEAVFILDPVIVVEVASPSTQRLDALTKFKRYFDNLAIRHYLIVVPSERTLIHHARRDDRGIETSIHNEGTLHLDPPGLALDVPTLFEGLENRSRLTPAP